MRLCFVLALAGAVSAAHASFELMILPNASSSVLSRWDPVSRVNLGTIGEQGGSNVLSTNMMSTGNVLATTAGGSNLYDPSTGAYQGSIPLPTSYTSADPTRTTLFESFAQNVYQYSGTTGAYINTLNVGFSIAGVIGVTGTKAFVYGTNGTGDLVGRGVDFSLMVAGAMTTYISAADMGSSSLIGMGASTFNASNGGYTLRFTYRNALSTNQILVLNYSSSLTLNSYSNTPINGFGPGALSVINGHAGYYVVGDDASSASITRLSRFGTNNQLLGFSTTSSVDVPTIRWSGTNILAPEPGPFVAMGLGLAALIVRRRRK